MILPSQKLHRFNPLFGGFAHPIGIICLYRGKIVQPPFRNHLLNHFLKLTLDYFNIVFIAQFFIFSKAGLKNNPVAY
jgi:hypothetical protein